MKSISWKDTFEFVGIAAIIASLIFVGQQLRLDRKIAMGDAWLQHVETQVILSDLIARNSKLWISGLDGDELTPGDQLTFDQLSRTIEQTFASRFIRSSLDVRSGPADGVAIVFAHEMYLHAGLRNSVLTQWSRWPERFLGEMPFRTAVRRELERFDSGELKANDKKSYVY